MIARPPSMRWLLLTARPRPDAPPLFESLALEPTATAGRERPEPVQHARRQQWRPPRPVRRPLCPVRLVPAAARLPECAVGVPEPSTTVGTGTCTRPRPGSAPTRLCRCATDACSASPSAARDRRGGSCSAGQTGLGGSHTCQLGRGPVQHTWAIRPRATRRRFPVDGRALGGGEGGTHGAC